MKPPVFWKDKPAVHQQLKRWNRSKIEDLLKKLEEILVKIGETEILMKKNSYLRNDIIIKNLIIDLTNKAATF